MRPLTKVYLVDGQSERFFGDGPYRLLKLVEQTGSLRAAAMEMGMAYTKALRLLRQAERAMGVPLTTRETGGKDGGGSRLTETGKELTKRYEIYTQACVAANGKLFEEIFAGFGQTPPDHHR